MKTNSILTIFATSLLLASCSTAKKTYVIQAKSNTKTAGTASFIQNKNTVKMSLNATQLTPGIHAIHIHEFGDCSSADAKSAGGHWNPSGEMHGKWEKDEFHMGDIGNLVADKNGVAKLTFSTDKWCIGCNDVKKNILGKSIVIHADEDDFHSQPIGNAGGRIGCVEIK